jgi:hypothetical protein
MSKIKFEKLLKRERVLYDLGFTDYPSIDYNYNKLLMNTTQYLMLNNHILSKIEYNELIKSKIGKWILIPNSLAGGSYSLLYVNNKLKMIPIFKKSYCYNKYKLNYIPWIIISDQVTFVLKDVVKHSQIALQKDYKTRDITGKKKLVTYTFDGDINKDKFKRDFMKKYKISDMIEVTIDKKNALLHVYRTNKIKFIPPQNIKMKKIILTAASYFD